MCCVCGAGCISVYSSLYSSSHVEWYVCVVCVVLVVFQCTPRCTAARTLSGMCVCGAGCISVYSSLYSSSHVEWYVCVVCVVLVVFQVLLAVQQLAS